MQEKLNKFLNSSDATLVSLREEAAAITPPDMSSGQLSLVHGTCGKLLKNMISSVEQMKEVLDSHDVNYSKKATPDSSTTPSPNEDSLADAMLQASIYDNSASSSDTDAVAEDIEGITHHEYPILFLHCVASIPYFAVGTQFGLHSPSPDHRQTFTDREVRALCRVPHTDNAILIVDGQIEVHRLGDTFGQEQPIDFLPMPEGMGRPCLFECIGATDGEIPYYVVTDINNYCIHLWYRPSRGWCQPFNMRNLAACTSNSFKMCVYQDKIYVTVYQTGMVSCLALTGEILWVVTEVGVRPTGIAVDHSGVYVCDGEGGNHCINIYRHDGTPINSILGNVLQRPWSVAVCGRVIAVLERYFNDDMETRPMAVTIAHMDAL